MSKHLWGSPIDADVFFCLRNELVVCDGASPDEVPQLHHEIIANAKAASRQLPMHDKPGTVRKNILATTAAYHSTQARYSTILLFFISNLHSRETISEKL